MRKKPERFSREYLLTAADIERLSEALDERLQLFVAEQQSRIRIRLSMEESLLRMRDHFGVSARVRLSLWNRFGRPVVQIVHEGEQYNPLNKTEASVEDWSGTLLTAVGLCPQYSYSRGRNILRLNLPVHRMNPAVKTVLAVLLGTLLGLFCTSALSPLQQASLVEAIFRPLYDLWIRILSVLSGPVIFLMVITASLNTGGIEEEGGSSKRVMLRYFAFSLIAAVATGLVMSAFAGDLFSPGAAWASGTPGYLARLLSVVPENAIAPLIEANTPQILLLAFLLGNGLVILGARAEGLTSLVRQSNMVGLLMAEWISRCVPYFTVCLVCYETLSRQTALFRWLCLALLLSLAAAFLCLVLALRSVSRQQKVPVGRLMKKLRPAFATALKTGSLDSGFGQMQSSCVRDLGIEQHFLATSLPMGMTLYMPVTVVGILIFTICAAVQQGIPVSGPWLIVAVVLTVVMSAAAPPVPGASLLTYIMLFSELGIPEAALVAAMVFDILFGIFAAAGNQTLLQLDLILQADRIGLLDRERLQAP